MRAKIIAWQDCSFCGKARQKVEALVVGDRARICDECVGLCDVMIAEYKAKRKSPHIPTVPDPEIEEKT